jgi:two-component system response regulator
MASKSVLLVEDNPDDVTLMLRALRRANVVTEDDVAVARDGVEALEYLAGTGSHPDRAADLLPAVVLLDLKLPKVNGLEVLRHVRADDRTKLIPVVIVTSSDEEHDVIEGYRLGANSYVRKPEDFEQFVDAVRQMGLYWLFLNRVPPRQGA